MEKQDKKSWNLLVPKLLHFYWGGDKMVYLRYLTIKTFTELNPDWDIIFWYPKRSFKGKSWGIEPGNQALNLALCKDYLPEVMAMNITKIPVDFDKLGFGANMAEVHKNDYIRISALNHYGGLWSDTDIIYFRPIVNISVNNPENKDKEVYVCIGDYGHSTGLNMATPNSYFFSLLVDRMNKEYKSNEYQCWGPDMFNKYFRKMQSITNGVNIPMDTVYAHNCHNVAELLNESQNRFTDESIGCHWYGGNSIWGKFLNETGGGVNNLSNNIISQLIKHASQ